ncbi:HNH endonuclease [Mesorhizobium sp. M1A.F.Ca.ET.072.01.1.1]|uniref:HNH endonuclease signature motif containing protein n=1 Tax=Mesorhizobium sp. M1A.F.Ca.ET.072.01.1.1 TaxID=2496753 RepID=UPI000FD60159|nr:HNH endonuclease signature motif containing protein [Mesorhizobium sp. M1A.F.Ca.ET.072.01.1.1]RUW55077.1 HNH endonuclease [Mesorhizobium sp. M1A.F.Ca.ET.072.01.1.1]TIV04747.1 MAG: HNH endonuclease [Mesorhizobium sp.]
MPKPDRRSPEAAEYRRLYKTARWLRLRERQLAAQPLCGMCLLIEDVTAADTVDHVKPHRGDAALFYDPSNLQSLCKYHHDSVKQRLERGSKIVMYGLDGYPIEFD